jgi:toxin ParE1/3/4
MSDNFPKPSAKIIYSAKALADLEEIWSHIAEDSEDFANKTVAKIIEKFQKLLAFPKIGKTRHELFIGLRSFPEGNYVIFYQETATGVEIVRIIHGSRDVDRIFDEMTPPE